MVGSLVRATVLEQREIWAIRPNPTLTLERELHILTLSKPFTRVHAIVLVVGVNRSMVNSSHCEKDQCVKGGKKHSLLKKAKPQSLVIIHVVRFTPQSTDVSSRHLGFHCVVSVTSIVSSREASKQSLIILSVAVIYSCRQTNATGFPHQPCILSSKKRVTASTRSPFFVMPLPS